MVKKGPQRGRPCKKTRATAVATAPAAARDSRSKGAARSVTATEPDPGVEPCLFPCPTLRRVPDDSLSRMRAVRECKDEEAGVRMLGCEDLDALQLELEAVLSSVVVRLSQLNHQLTVLGSLETASQGRGRKHRKTRAIIPAVIPAPPPPPADEKPSISRPPVKIPIKKLGNIPPSAPSPGPSQPSSKRSKMLRKRPDVGQKNKSQIIELEKDIISHKFWSSLDPYCCEVTEESYNILSDILCRNQSDVPYFYEVPPLGEHFSKELDLKDFGENQDFPAASSSASCPSTPSSPSSSTMPTSESIGSAIRRKFRECSLALKRTLCTEKATAPASPPPTPATSKLMAALLGETPPPIAPLQESKDHNVIVKVEKEDDEKPLLKTSRPDSASGSSSNSEVTRKHQRKCLDRKFRLEKDAQGNIDFPSRSVATPQSLLDELKRTQAELKRVVDHNSRMLVNLSNNIADELRIQNLKRKLHEIDDTVIDIYHTRTAAKLAKQTISQEDVEQAWKALKERDKIIRQIELCELRWDSKAMSNL